METLYAGNSTVLLTAQGNSIQSTMGTVAKLPAGARTVLVAKLTGGSGAPAGVDAILEGSIDNKTWFNLATVDLAALSATATRIEVIGSQFLCSYMRARFDAVSHADFANRWGGYSFELTLGAV